MAFESVGARVAGVALAVLAPVSAAACGESQSTIDVTAQRDIPVLGEQNVLDEQISVLHPGQMAVALCFAESANLAVDSVKVQTYDRGAYRTGYAFTQYRTEGPNGPLIDTFDVTSGQLADQLPDC